MAAVVQNNTEAAPPAAGGDQSDAKQPATVVAAVTKPEVVDNVNLVAQTDGKTATTTPKDNKQTTAASNPAPTATSSATAVDGQSSTFQGQPDDFYNAIFYFSGMGSVIGSALSEGVYVAEQYRKNAIDADELLQERKSALSKVRSGGKAEAIGRRGQLPAEDVVITARGQAQNLSTDLQKLQTLLESLPVFTGNADQLPLVGDRRSGAIDQPIHGELYFRCKERFPVQQPSSSSPAAALRQTQPSPHDSLRSGASGEISYHTEEVRRRRNYDDAVLADVARAAVDSFPLMPPPRQPGSRGSTTPVRDVYQQQDDQASRRARRREANSSTTASSPSPAAYVYGSGASTPSSWQTPHVY
jgi:hypothetical protein